MRAPAAFALLALIAAKDDPGAALDQALAGRVAGPPVSCIDSQSSDGPQIIDDRTLIYRSAGRIWRNTLPEACPSLRDDSILIVDIHGGQLCRDDHFRTVTRGMGIPSGYCRFGDFIPYTKVKAPKPPKPQ